MITTRNPVLSRGFAYDDVDPSVLRGGSSSPSTPMTVEGTIVNAFVMFVPLVLVAAVAYVLAPPVLMLPAILVAAGLGLWASLAKRVRPAVMFAYAVAEGVVLGVLSAVFEARYPGIVVQAVLATLVTAGVVLALYRLRVVRATARFTKIVLFAGVGYLVFLLVNLVFALSGAGDGAGVYGSPWGLLFAAFGAVLAAAFLVLDFGAIEQGVRSGAPQEMEWRAAFGLMLTLVWLYVEMLRVLAILRR